MHRNYYAHGVKPHSRMKVRRKLCCILNMDPGTLLQYTDDRQQTQNLFFFGVHSQAFCKHLCHRCAFCLTHSKHMLSNICNVSLSVQSHPPIASIQCGMSAACLVHKGCSDVTEAVVFLSSLVFWLVDHENIHSLVRVHRYIHQQSISQQHNVPHTQRC